jgi:YebC/PmpR family DNA-binding regulatory protein
MAGHSKWSNIKRKKEKEDAGRGRIFTKIARQITIAAREGGGGDPTSNFRLRLAIDAARAVNMPNENIQRAIKRGTGELESVNYEEIVYEGYGPAGVAILMDIATDNRNRTAGEIRFIMSKYGGNLGESGCVAWMFEKKGVLLVTGESLPSEDDVLLMALEAGAEDVVTTHEGYEIICAPEDFPQVNEQLQSILPLEQAELTMRPKNNTVLGYDDAQRVIALIEMLEDNDDVQAVYTNMELTAETIAALQA